VRRVTSLRSAAVTAGGAHVRASTTLSSVGVGLDAQRSLTTGSNNTALGQDAQRSLTTGSSNTALGQDAQNTDGTTATIATVNHAIAIGFRAQNTASNTAVIGSALPAERVSLCLGNYGDTGGGRGLISLTNAQTVPTSTYTGGGLLYAEAGALKWRGSSGTITTIAPA